MMMPCSSSTLTEFWKDPPSSSRGRGGLREKEEGRENGGEGGGHDVKFAARPLLTARG